MLWEDSDADVPGQCTAGEGEEAGGLTTIVQSTPGIEPRLSDQVLTSTTYLGVLNFSLQLDGVFGWRMPTFAELQTILLPEPYPCSTSPCIDPIFGPTQSYYYWSSTTNANNPNNAWLVDFNYGYVISDNKSTDAEFYVRAVRGGL